MSRVMNAQVGVATLIGRAWNLYKRHFKTCFLLMLFPTILNMIASLLVTLPSPLHTKNLPMDGAQIAWMVILAILALVVSLAVMVFSFVSNSCLIYIFYRGITQETPCSVKESLAALKSRWPSLIALSILVVVAYIAFLIIDGLLFLLGMLMVSGVGAVIALSHQPVLVGIGIGLSVLLGFLGILFLFCLLLTEIWLCGFPFMALITQPELKLIPAIQMAMRLLFKNISRALRLSLSSWVVIGVLAIVLTSPVLGWIGFEVQYLKGLPHGSLIDSMSVPLSVTSHLWGNLINAIILPFSLAVASLFWYDCQVGSEGLDIRLQLDRLRLTQKV